MNAILIAGSNPASSRFADSEVINGHLYVGGRLVDHPGDLTLAIPAERWDAEGGKPRAQRTRRSKSLREGPVEVLNPDRKKVQFLILFRGSWSVCFEGSVPRTAGGKDEFAWFDCVSEGVVCWQGDEAAAVALQDIPKAVKLLELAELELDRVADRVPVAPGQYVRAALACLKHAVRS